MNNNSIRVVSPYKWNGIWVFDDPITNLEREAFVAGIDLMLDQLTRSIPNAEQGFNLLFSDTPFPDYHAMLEWVKEDTEFGGNWYYCSELKQEGWLCPALYLYYATAPKNLYIQVRALL